MHQITAHTAAAAWPDETQVLVLTCQACHQVREHPAGEPVSFECPCGGWVLTAHLLAEGGAR